MSGFEKNREMKKRAGEGVVNINFGQLEGLTSLDGAYNEADTSLEIGPKEVSFISLSTLNVLSQVRTEFDKDDLGELAQSMLMYKDDGTVEIKLVQSITIGVHTLESAKKYLDTHAEYNLLSDEDRVTIDMLNPNKDGFYDILTAGNRRVISVHGIGQQLGFDPKDIKISAMKEMNPEFVYSDSLQYRENNHKRPNPADLARRIELQHLWMIKTNGIKPSHKAVAHHFGTTSEAVKNALEFAELPEEVRLYAYKGLAGRVLPYATVRRLKPLYDALLSINNHDKELATNELVTFCNIELARMLKSNSMIIPNRLIANRTDEMKGHAAWQQGVLFSSPEYTASGRSHSARNLAIGKAIGMIDIAEITTGLKDSEVVALQGILDRTKALRLQEPNTTDPNAFDFSEIESANS